MSNPVTSAARPARPTGSIAFAFGIPAAALLVFAIFYGVYTWNSVKFEKMSVLRP